MNNRAIGHVVAWPLIAAAFTGGWTLAATKSIAATYEVRDSLTTQANHRIPDFGSLTPGAGMEQSSYVGNTIEAEVILSDNSRCSLFYETAGTQSGISKMILDKLDIHLFDNRAVITDIVDCEEVR